MNKAGSAKKRRAHDVAHAGCAEGKGEAFGPSTGITENPRRGPVAANRLGLLFYVDTNFVDNPSPEAAELRALYQNGWLGLIRTDTVDTELGDKNDPERRAELLDASAQYPESLGPLVLGHSRLDHAVLGSDEDDERLDRVFRVLFPYGDRHATSGRARRKLRDAMHVATAMRYGADAFVTADHDDLVSKSDDVAAAFNGFRIMTPSSALAFARRMLHRYNVRTADNQDASASV